MDRRSIRQQILKRGDLVKIKKLNVSSLHAHFENGIVIKLDNDNQMRLLECYKVFNFTTKQIEYTWEKSLEVISVS